MTLKPFETPETREWIFVLMAIVQYFFVILTFLVVTARYLVVTARYRSLLPVPTFSMNVFLGNF